MPETAKTPSPAVQLEEIRHLVAHDLPALPVIAPDTAAGAWAATQAWLAASQHKTRPAFGHPRIALFAAAHGTAPAPDYTGALERLGPLAQAVNADLKVYDLGQAEDEENIAARPLHDDEAAHAMAYGMMAVQPDLHILALSSLHPSAEDAGRAVTPALQDQKDPWQALLSRGGLDIAAMTGSIIAARLARVPVLTAGAAAQAACDILESIKTGATAHCRPVESLPLGQTNAGHGVQISLALAALKALPYI